MVRSSVAAFYPLPRCHFYRRCALPSDAFSIVFFVRRLGRSQVKKIVHRMSEILLAAEIPFRRLDGCMAEQKLNLLKLTAAAVAQFGTCPTQIVRCNML
jgi:hypothetical protein